MLTGIRVRKNYFLKLLLNSQKRPGSGSAIRKNAGSGSALNQCGSETLVVLIRITTYRTHRYIIFSLINFIFAKVLHYNFILQALFQSAQHIYEKREGSGSGSVPLTNGSRSGSGSLALLYCTDIFAPAFKCVLNANTFFFLGF
jgi:hypothetical protein